VVLDPITCKRSLPGTTHNQGRCARLCANKQLGVGARASRGRCDEHLHGEHVLLVAVVVGVALEALANAGGGVARAAVCAHARASALIVRRPR
jgi:hypothetical protein